MMLESEDGAEVEALLAASTERGWVGESQIARLAQTLDH